MRNRVSRTMQLAGLGKDLALCNRRGASHQDQRRLRVIGRLAALHGLPQKIGQILSLAELTSDFPVYTNLTEASDRLSPDDSYAEINRAFGTSWKKHFSSLDPRGVIASLARVYRATLHDGREVAVKIQYPEIAEALETDLAALGWLTVPFGNLRKGFDLSGYRREVGQMLRDEINYRHEAEMLRRFQPLAATIENLEVPETIDELCGDKILVMTWLQGKPFSDCRQWPSAERRQIGETLVKLFLESVFSHQMVHADPHPGNYRFRRNPTGIRIGLLDFGCVKSLHQTKTSTLATLIGETISGGLHGRPDKAQMLFERLGFDPLLLRSMQHLLPPVCDILFEPFLRDQPFDMACWQLADRMDVVLGPKRWNFRMSGPPDLIYFMRAYQGLVQYLAAIAEPVNWRSALEQIEAFRATSPLPERETHATDFTTSTTLRIQVHRGEQTKINLTFPAAAAEDLASLLPPEVAPKLIQRNIDILQIVQRIESNGFAPGELFHIVEGKDDFRIWLE